jgi:hypothetical protein
MMRVAIYARVSTKGVGRQDAENQLRQLRAFAESQSWTAHRIKSNGWTSLVPGQDDDHLQVPVNHILLEVVDHLAGVITYQQGVDPRGMLREG